MTTRRAFRLVRDNQKDVVADYEVRISAKSSVHNTINVVSKKLLFENQNKVVLKAIGGAISNSLWVANIVRRRIEGIAMIQAIKNTQIQEQWTPLLEGLKDVVVIKVLSQLEITLTKAPTEVDKKQIGFQPALPKEEQELYSEEDKEKIKEFEPRQFDGQQRPRQFRGGRGNGGRNFGGPRQGGGGRPGQDYFNGPPSQREGGNRGYGGQQQQGGRGPRNYDGPSRGGGRQGGFGGGQGGFGGGQGYGGQQQQGGYGQQQQNYGGQQGGFGGGAGFNGGQGEGRRGQGRGYGRGDNYAPRQQGGPQQQFQNDQPRRGPSQQGPPQSQQGGRQQARSGRNNQDQQ